MSRSALALAAVVSCLVIVGLALAVGGGGGGDPLSLTGPDPFAFEEYSEDELLRRGRDGLAHVLYELSPGGADRTASRVERWRPQVGRAAQAEGVDPATLEALVFLESAGRSEAIAGPSADSAGGLAQILPATASDLLGLPVDLERSKRLTRQIDAADRRADRERGRPAGRAAARRAERLRDERRRVDGRFDPPRALAAAARYLALAHERLGREDLAIVSYHMGLGNLEDVIETYVEPKAPEEDVRATVEENDVSFARLYFDSSPVRNPATYAKLEALGDDSRHYLFKLEAAREIMRLHREDPGGLANLVALHGRKASAEEVLRPESQNPPFADADALRAAYDGGDLVALPPEPRRLGVRADPGMGALASELGEAPATYRGLRPAALATALHLASEVRRVAGEPLILMLTSTVRDVPYTRGLADRNPEATRGFSLHTTGYAFDVARDLDGRGERALVYALERLRALAIVDWVFEPGAIHVTVGPEGDELVERVEGLDG